MVGVNFAVLVGNVGQDPEIKATQTGGKVARFRLATSEQWRDKTTGEKRERTEWHTVVVFTDGLVGVVEQYVKKGSRLYIQGTIRTRDWEDDAGIRRFSTEIHLSGFDSKLVLESTGNRGGRAPMPDESERHGPGPGAAGSGGGGDTGESGGDAGAGDLDDDIPF